MRALARSPVGSGGARKRRLVKLPSGYVLCMRGSRQQQSRQARRRIRPVGSAANAQREPASGGVGPGRAGSAALLLALYVGLALPSPVAASSGVLTHATLSPDHTSGWLAGSVTWDQCTSSADCWWAA